MSGCRAGMAVWVVAALCVTACVEPQGQAATRTLVVEAGDQARTWVPMSIETPKNTTTAKMSANGTEVPCQVAEGKLWWILDRLDAGATKSYTVELGTAPSAPPSAVSLKQADETVDIAIGGKPFTTYNFTLKKSCGQQLRRPCFFPVYGPDQVLMVRPYPLTDTLPIDCRKDHPHHTSIWVAYGKVNGTDNWSIHKTAGWQVHKGFETVASGAVMGMFRESLDWTSVDKKPVMAETRTARVYAQPDTHRMLDLEVRFIAKYGQVEFGDTKEGGLCATRMRPEFRHDKKYGKDGKLVNDQGQLGGAAWGKKAAWVDASGTVDGKRLGFAIFDAPTNLRHPTTWHARTYRLLTANPFGLSYFTRKKERGEYTLDAGKELVFRYRIYFHVGDEKAGQVAARYGDYATPPKAAWR